MYVYFFATNVTFISAYIVCKSPESFSFYHLLLVEKTLFSRRPACLISVSCNILCLVADQKINQKGQETMTAFIIFGFERSRAMVSLAPFG